MEGTMVVEQKILSFGELLIGIELASEDDDQVTKIKKMFAEITNILKDAYTDDMRSPIRSLAFDHAVGEIMNAQMSVVKVITLK
jgi:hypothetical protein